MKFKLKLQILLAMLFIAVTNLSAQNYKIEFEHDAAGNRIERRTVTYIPKQAIPVASKSILEDHDITVFPNPTRGQLEVKVTNLTKDNRTSITLIDISGRKIFRKDNIGASTDIDMSENTNGVYIMRITIDSKSVEWKIIKKE